MQACIHECIYIQIVCVHICVCVRDRERERVLFNSFESHTRKLCTPVTCFYLVLMTVTMEQRNKKEKSTTMATPTPGALVS